MFLFGAWATVLTADDRTQNPSTLRTIKRDVAYTSSTVAVPLLSSLRRIHQDDSAGVVSAAVARSFVDALSALDEPVPTPSVDAAIVRCNYYKSPLRIRIR